MFYVINHSSQPCAAVYSPRGVIYPRGTSGGLHHVSWERRVTFPSDCNPVHCPHCGDLVGCGKLAQIFMRCNLLGKSQDKQICDISLSGGSRKNLGCIFCVVAESAYTIHANPTVRRHFTDLNRPVSYYDR